MLDNLGKDVIPYAGDQQRITDCAPLRTAKAALPQIPALHAA